MLAVLVGVIVAGISEGAGATGCSGPRRGLVQGGARDAVCDQLVQTLAGRVGVAAAIATAVIVLSLAGVRRLTLTGPALNDEQPRPG